MKHGSNNDRRSDDSANDIELTLMSYSAVQKCCGRRRGRATATRPRLQASRACWLCPFALWLNGGRTSADILGESRVLKLWGEGSSRLNNKHGGWGYSLHLGPCLAETTIISSRHASPFNLGSKRGRCGDNREYFVVMYDNTYHITRCYQPHDRLEPCRSPVLSESTYFPDLFGDANFFC